LHSNYRVSVSHFVSTATTTKSSTFFLQNKNNNKITYKQQKERKKERQIQHRRERIRRATGGISSVAVTKSNIHYSNFRQCEQQAKQQAKTKPNRNKTETEEKI